MNKNAHMKRDMSARPAGTKKAGKGHKTVIAIVVLIVVFSLLAGLVFVLWGKAHEGQNPQHNELKEAISQSEVKTPASDTYVATNDKIENTLLVETEYTKSGESVLKSISVISSNQTKGNIVVVSLPTDALLGSQGQTASAVYQESSSKQLISMLAEACGVNFNHVVVIDQEGMATLKELKSSGATSLVSAAGKLLNHISTDMDTPELLMMAENMHSAASGSAQRVSAKKISDKTSAGVVINKDKFGLAIGALAKK